MNVAERRSHTPKGRLARQRILRVAERLLAARGFYGTSVRDIAEACGLPLATVLYHFARKERIHAAVLGEIAGQLERTVTATLAAEGTHGERLDGAVRALVRWSERQPGRVRFLLRELLDNPTRVAKAKELPLAPVLRAFAAFVADGVRAGAFATELPEVAVLHVVGALSYFVASRPTVRRIVGPDRDDAMTRAYEDEVVAFARRALSSESRKEKHHGATNADRARPPRPRARRSEDHRRRGAADDARRRRVP